MIIDKNGILNLESIGMKIGPGFSLDEFKNNPYFTDFEYGGGNDNYARYAVRQILIDNLPFSIYLIFYKNKISQFTISYNELTRDSGYEPAKRRIELVDLTKKKHDEWVIKEHRAIRRKYPWGFISSNIGDHTYFANILTMYNSPENEYLYKNFK